MPADASDTRARIVADICERIAAGESVAAIFRDPQPSYPNAATFWRWLGSDPEARGAYDAATSTRSERYAEEIVDIADDAATPLLNDEGKPILGRDGFPVMVQDKTATEHARLRIDARKWVASKLVPKKYGDRTILAGDADNPLIVDVSDAKSSLLGRLGTAVAAAGTGKVGSGPE